MQRVQVRVPATLTSVGSGLHSVGLALSMHSHVTLEVRDDTELSVNVSGNASDQIPATLDNPALLAAIRVFQQKEDAPVGLHVDVYNAIPFESGMGEVTALVVGGLMAAQNLINPDLTRDDLIRMALRFNLPYEGIVTAILGGVGLCSMSPEAPHQLAYSSLETPPMRVIVVRPEFDETGDDAPNFAEVRYPEALRLVDSIRDTRQALMLAESLRTGNYDLIRRTLHNPTHNAKLKASMPHFDTVFAAAMEAGAAGLTFAGDGSLLLAFAEEEPHDIADAIINAFTEHDIKARRWVLPIDRQGVVISVLGDDEDEDEDSASEGDGETEDNSSSSNGSS